MKSLFIILLAGCSVRSDVNNYYVIEMQDVPPTQSPKADTKPFNVYWNVPTMQCASKHIHFENLFENFGIIQNDNDRFKGEKVTILYDPGLFPALFKNESGGKIRFRNGGVPQEGNLNKHLDEFKKELDRSVPDNTFSGIGIIDFESWRPQFRQNFGVLQPYKDVSFEIERKLHWWWKEAWIKDEAKRRFEESARTFMQSTLSVAKKLRPLARWGFYGFPYCFNMASNNLVETCANGVPQENDDISWLWSESSALYPSVYSSARLSAAQLAALVRGRLREAARAASRHAQILPYFWFRYRDAGFLTETDLSTALSMLYKSAASGIIIWGSSNDVNTVDKCTRLKNYVQNVLGPAIARYTKPTTKDNDDIEDITALITDTEKPASNLVSNIDIGLDPEFHWMPPQNYTQDLKDDIEEHMNNRFGETVTNDDNSSVLQNNSVLIDLILNEVLNSVDNATTTTDNPKTKYDKKNQYQNELIDSTTEINDKTSTGTSQVTSSFVTNNPLLNETNNTSTKLELQSTEVASSEVPIFDVSLTTEKIVLETEKIQTALRIETETIDSVNETTTTAKPNTENDYDATSDEDDDDDFYNSDAFILFYNQETTITVENHTLNFDESNTDFTKNEKKVQTYTTKTETSAENVIILTTDKSDNLEVSSTEFNDTESVSENNNSSKEATNGNQYNTESNTISIQTTEYAPVEDITLSTVIASSIKTTTVESSTNNNELNDARRSDKYESNNSDLTTTSTSLNIIDILNLPNETRNVGFETEGLDVSETIDSKSQATEETNTSTAPETSTIRGYEDTDAPTSIVPSTDQVVVY